MFGQQPHQESHDQGVDGVIDKSNRQDAGNQSAVAPEPEILVQYRDEQENRVKEAFLHQFVVQEV
jgi:hypothetical protein